VVIHVGRFDYAKGFDTILDVLPALGQHYPIKFIGIGGTKSDLLYDRARDLGVEIHEFMPQADLVRYYSASDVYLFPKFYDKKSEANTEKFMGAGVATAEALGCGLPVIGTNLKGFFATPEELKGIGGIPKDAEDTIQWVSDVFENSSSYSRCREVAMKYYSWQPIVERLLYVFDELMGRYY
jgi:glycosyltransferase involved in cell wall biosynthesis